MITMINELGETWTTYMGLSIIQDSIFLGLLFLVLYWLRNASAKIKYNVTLIGLFKLILPPLLPASFLRWQSGSESVEIGPIMLQAIVANPEKTSGPIFNIHALMFLIWTVTILTFLGIQIVSTLRLRQRLHSSEVIAEDISIENKSVILYKNKWITMPLTFGIMKKRIYVPDQWETWSKDCQKMILAHELAHIQRKDGLMKTIQMVVQSVYFFHPLVWLLGKRLNEYREMACDDLSVTTRKGSNVEYSRYLVQIAENLVQTSLGYSSASALIKQKNELLNRVKYQLEGTMKNLSRKKLTIVLTPLLLLLIPLSLTFSKTENMPESSGKTTKADVGKIYGTVVDEETGEILTHSNIIIKGTQLGAATDQDGKFWIIGVPTGKYDVVAAYMGYKSVLKSDVKVEANKSTELNFKLPVSVINLPDNLSDAPPPPPPDDDVLVFVSYDKPPMPIGGFKAIQKNLIYPELARKAGIEGRVVVYAQVDENGDVVKTKVVESIEGNNGCDEAAVKAVQSVKWKPAEQRDKRVKVWIAVPIDFRLDENSIQSQKTPKSINMPRGTFFVEYDTPPMPVEGFDSIQKNLIYPESARKQGIEGRVTIYILINKVGNITDTKIAQAHDILNAFNKPVDSESAKGIIKKFKLLEESGCTKAAVDAVNSVKWKPAQKDKQNISVWIAVPIDFKLN